MQLSDIDKKQYRHRLNRIIVGFIASFMALALAFGTILIALFSDGDGSNFRFNLMGVVLALLAVMAILHSLRNKPYFAEAYTVFKNKQQLNLIHRKLAKLKHAAKEGNVEALVALNHYYQSYKIIYYLDDNTITIASIERDHQQVLDWAKQYLIDLDNRRFDINSIQGF